MGASGGAGARAGAQERADAALERPGGDEAEQAQVCEERADAALERPGGDEAEQAQVCGANKDAAPAGGDKVATGGAESGRAGGGGVGKAKDVDGGGRSSVEARSAASASSAADGNDDDVDWVIEEMRSVSLGVFEAHESLLRRCAAAVPRWRTAVCGAPPGGAGEGRGDAGNASGNADGAALWQRLTKRQGGVSKMVKEVVECAPVLSECLSVLEALPPGGPPATVLDLCCGKGFLSMFLSELLPERSVERILLVDKAWPPAHDEPSPQHMSPAHLMHPHERVWRVPLEPLKRDLKKGRERAQLLANVVQSAPGPVLILAVHLCGALSLHAVELFNFAANKICLLALKPCCLPAAQKNDDKIVLHAGAHAFVAAEVSVHGRFSRNEWSGQTRSHLRPKFEKWCGHIFKGIDVTGADLICVDGNGSDDAINTNDAKGGDGQASLAIGEKRTHGEALQTAGGYQNTYIFARRSVLATRVPVAGALDSLRRVRRRAPLREALVPPN